MTALQGPVLVVGAREGSLGAAVAAAVRQAGGVAYTAGISGEEWELDLVGCDMRRIWNVLSSTKPCHIVCTVGMNTPEPDVMDDPIGWYSWHFETNVTAPMRLLHGWQEWSKKNQEDVPMLYRHYVAISSNSAAIPRSSSAAYCASKAALSMALRVKAREGKGGDQHGIVVYGYEPGLLAGTPMTKNTENDFPGALLHRMRGSAVAEGIPVEWLAEQIVTGLRSPGAALNGTLIRYDAGEL